MPLNKNQIGAMDLSPEIKNKYGLVNETFFQVAKEQRSDFLDVEIGDSKQPDFYPQVKLKRWNNEVNFSARLVHDEVEPEIKTEEDKIIWAGKNIDAKFYDLPDDEGGYEFEVILKKKPKTNKVEFTIETKDLDFLYQGRLDEEQLEPEEVSADERHTYDKDGKVMAERAENVIGSYAVYYKNNVAGDFSRLDKNNYKSGKAFHIYRPEIIDADGEKIWGKLNIDVDNKKLSIEIPQDFLDKAVYPIVVDPTFGYTSVPATTSSWAVDTIRGWEYAMPAYAGTVYEIVSYCASNTGTGNWRGVVYNQGTTGTLVTYGSQVSTAETNLAWRILAVTQASLAASTTYKIGWWIGGYMTAYYDSGITQHRFTLTYHATNAPTSPWTETSSTADRKIGIYARFMPTTSGDYTETYETVGTFSWLCPTNVTSVNVACRGGGGGGAGGDGANHGGGGGGGGAYSYKANISVTPGSTYTVVVGAGGTGTSYGGGNAAAGADSSFNTTSCVAKAGAGGSTALTGGAGGLASGSTGDTKYDGGTGGNGASVDNGGGGGGAGCAGSHGAGVNGNNAVTTTSGTGGAGDNSSGGAGGAIATKGGVSALGGGGGGGANGGASTGGAGGESGGGGGGGQETNDGGKGACGSVIITYTVSAGTTMEKTIQSKADIKILNVSKTEQAKARIKKAGMTKTATAKARIKQTSIIKTVQAKARVEKPDIIKTVQAKGRLKQVNQAKTVTAKGRLKQTNLSKTESAKARVKKTNQAKTTTAKGRIKKLNNSATEQAKARIKKANQVKTATAKARMKRTGLIDTIQSKARVKSLSAAKSIQSKARIGSGNFWYAGAKARIKQERLIGFGDTGWHSPSIVEFDQWTNPTYAFAEDGLYTSESGAAQETRYSGFNFDIPYNAIIIAVAARVKCYTSNSRNFRIALNHSGFPQYDYKNITSPASLEWVTVGGDYNTLDTWGESLNPWDFNDNAFDPYLYSLSGTGTVYVDIFQFKIFYYVENGLSVKADIKQFGVSYAAQAKAKIIHAGVAATIRAKADIKKFNISTIISGKARIGSPGDMTIDAKADIKKFGVVRSTTVKSRIKHLNLSAAVQAKARMEHSNNIATIQAKARLVKYGSSKAITAKADIKKSGIAKSLQAKGRIEHSNNSAAVQAKGRIKRANQAKTTTTKARLKKSGISYAIQVKASIDHPGGDISVQAKGRIKKLNNSATDQAKARIKQAGRVKTIQAKARIKKTSLKTIQAKVAIKRSGEVRTVQAKARIRAFNIVKTVQAKARIWAFASGYVKMKRRDQSYPLTLNASNDFQELRSTDQSGIITLKDNRIF